MSTLNWRLLQVNGDNNFFTANATEEPALGAFVLNTETQEIFVGDGTTQLQNLTAWNSSSSYTAGSGLSLSGNVFSLGGTLSLDTTITMSGYSFTYDGGIFNLKREASVSGAQLNIDSGNGQAEVILKRTPTSFSSPTAITATSGISRLRLAAYNGTAMSANYTFLQTIATETWTPTAAGFKVQIRPTNTGLLTGGFITEVTSTGVQINKTDTVSSALLSLGAGSATLPAISLTSQTDVSAPSAGNIWYSASGFNFQGSINALTDITTPLIYGSSASGGNLTLESTSNATKGRIIFSGVGTDNASIQGLVGSLTVPTLYMGVASPSATNFTLYSNGSATALNAPSTDNILFQIAGLTRMVVSNTTITLSPRSATTGAVTGVTYTVPASTNQTAGSNIPNFRITGNTKTWATGALALQYFNHLTANTVAFNGASTATLVANLAVEEPIQGANATLTNRAAIACNGSVFIADGSNVPTNNPTGGGLLYVEAGALKYRGSSGTVTTIANA
jgi:hypothetical protein